MRHRKAHLYMALLLSVFMVLAPGLSALGASANVQKVQDNELVISTLDDQGVPSSIQVLSHLRAFGSGSATIQDGSNYKLSSVRNLYGNEKISLTDNKLGVNVNMGESGSSDVYYMSDLDKSELAKAKMPVSVTVSYYLDGVKIEPSKLAGKSGHLKIVTDIENLTGVKKNLEYKDSQGKMVTTEAEVYTPFVVSLAGWEFDNKLFSNVIAPGVSGESAEGVVVDVQGKSTVTWTVPLIPPSYPAKQYTTVEADAKDIILPSFNIAVVPIIPATAAEDTLGTFQDSFSKLFDAFGQIKDGVGAQDKEGSTLLFGLASLKSGLSDLSGGIASLGDKVKELLTGVSNTKFNAATYNATKGVDSSGNKPGVREAVKMGKSALDTQVIPAMEGQKQVLDGLGAVVGKSGAAPVTPAASTSLYNDTTILRGVLGNSVTAPVTPSATTSLMNDITLLKGAVGSPVTAPVAPAATTSLYNDVVFLKGFLNSSTLSAAEKQMATAVLDGAIVPKIDAGSKMINGAIVPKLMASSDIINGAMVPKLGALGNNLTVLKSGGNLVTSTGTQAFPASVTTVEQGVKSLSTAMAQTDAGLGLITSGIGPIDANGQAIKVMVDGKPATILYALSYFNSSLKGEALPGLDQLLDGSSQIGNGAGKAQTEIRTGLDKMSTAPAIISALTDNAAQANTFLGKPDGAQAAVAYIFQTPQVSMQSTVMYYGLGAIALVLVILFAVGRPSRVVKMAKPTSQTV